MTLRSRVLGMLLALSLAPGGVLSAAPQPDTTAVPPVLLVRLGGAIGPASADLMQRAIDRATRERAQLLVLEIDTPGGLDSSMRSIVQSILASPVPVAAYVAPSGARAASAGTYILYACHLAAMAPATNLGAATPVAIGVPGIGPEKEPKDGASGSAEKPQDAMTAKRVHDASAYLRSLAQLRGRDAAWAEQAVREGVSLAAGEALERHVIDLMAADLPDLLRQLDGRKLRPGGPATPLQTLSTAQARVVVLEPTWRDRLLTVLSDPSLALLLMMVGIYGLVFEFMNPGFVAPGVVGGLCLLLALWGLQMLPINYTGLALILLGIVFFVAEAFVPSYGALGMGGIAAFVFGALLLVDSELPGFGIPLALIATLALLSAAVLIALMRMALRARARPVVSGTPLLLGARAEVIEFDPQQGEGWAFLQGERWRIRAPEALTPGQPVQVARVDGLRLDVRPAAPVTSTPAHEAANAPWHN